MKSISFYLTLVLFFISCKDASKIHEKKYLGAQKPESVQIFKMQELNGQYEKGKLNFSEKFIYNPNGIKLEHYILTETGEIKAKEIYVYQKEKLVGSNYLTAADSLLSYYVVLLDSLGNISSKKSFDGSNNELLRIETYEYDDEKQMKKKNIFDAMGNPVRTYHFQHDQYGNEISYQVYEPSGILIFKEDFKITKKDNQNRWLEKTGFRDDIPLTQKFRTFWSPKI